MARIIMTLLLALCVGGFTVGCKKEEPAAAGAAGMVEKAEKDVDAAAKDAKDAAEKAKADAEAEAAK